MLKMKYDYDEGRKNPTGTAPSHVKIGSRKLLATSSNRHLSSPCILAGFSILRAV